MSAGQLTQRTPQINFNKRRDPKARLMFHRNFLKGKETMTYITQLTSRKTMSILQIMTMILAGFVLVVLQSSTVHAQWTTNGNNINNTNTGNVGIGTTSPALPLDLRGNSLVITSDARVLMGNYDLTPMAQGVGGGVQFGGKFHSNGTIAGFASISGIKENATDNDFSSALVFTTRANPNTQTEKMRISSNGNIGIGTTTPANRLVVTGDGSGIGQFGTSGCGNNYVAITLSLTTAPSGCTNYTLTSSPNDQTLYINRPSGNAIRFRENNGSAPDQLVIASGGNVGIGITTPTKKLDVNGDINASGTITGGNIVAKYQDVAEWVESSQSLPVGTVVVLDHTRSNQVIASSQAYDTRVAGVISLQPGITLGENGAGKVLVATTGRVKIKVDASTGPIRIGDLLVTSGKEGFAKKSEPLNLGGVQIHRPGTLIGKALEPLEKGTGEILVLLSLQ
jgi:hypothetical protein